MSPIQRIVAVVLLVLVALSASAPHTHTTLADVAGGESRRDESQLVGRCDATRTSPAHFDAARLVHHADCLACLRQHQQGSGARAIALFAAIVFTAPPRAAAAVPRAAAAPAVHLRAPPSAA